MQNQNCLSYWFPRISDAGLLVPKTIIVRSPGDGWELAKMLDGKKPSGFDGFIREVTAAAESIGFPIFLRTGMGSGKHQWKDCCYVAKRKDLVQHVYNLVEWSHCVDLMGLPHDVWAVREMLLTSPIGVCERYGGMPVCREFRFFVDGGNVLCGHFYWPLDSLNEGGFAADVAEGWYDEFCRLPDDYDLNTLASKAGAAVGGSWSIDILETKRGWMIIDMALAAVSWHWPGCPNNPRNELGAA